MSTKSKFHEAFRHLGTLVLQEVLEVIDRQEKEALAACAHCRHPKGWHAGLPAVCLGPPTPIACPTTPPLWDCACKEFVKP